MHLASPVQGTPARAFPPRPGLWSESFVRPEWPDLDAAEAGHRMLRGDLDGLLAISTFEQIEAADPFPGLREGSVGDHHLALALSNGGSVLDAFQAGAEDPDLPPCHLLGPLAAVVFLGHVGLAGRIGAHEHDEAHGATSS